MGCHRACHYGCHRDRYRVMIDAPNSRNAIQAGLQVHE
jgi:hypothetical protein